jgi:hypothetical protein
MDGEPTTSTLFESRVIDPKWMLERTGHRPSLAGGRYSFHELRVRCKGMEIEALDDLPKKQGYRRPYYRDRKQLSHLFGPLKELSVCSNWASVGHGLLGNPRAN